MSLTSNDLNAVREAAVREFMVAAKRLSVTGEVFTRDLLRGMKPFLCEFDENAYAMLLESRSLMKEADPRCVTVTSAQAS